MGSTVIGVVLACLASCLFNGAIAVQALETRKVPQRHGLRLSLLRRLISRPRWLGGTALGALALPLQTVALLFAPLTVVQPCDAAGLLLLLYLGTRMLAERVGPREIAGVVALVVGIVILAIASPPREVTHPSASSVLVPLLAVAAVALSPFVLRRLLGPRSILVVLGAGAAFAVTAFCLKLIADALDRGDWAAFVVVLAVTVAAAAVGTLTEQSALQNRQATQVAPIIFVIEMLVPIALALAVVGETWSGSTGAIAVAIGMTVVGVVILARTPQLGGLLSA
jgi:drug/metabolite transporter (DMT)-like permease